MKTEIGDKRVKGQGEFEDGGLTSLRDHVRSRPQSKPVKVETLSLGAAGQGRRLRSLQFNDQRQEQKLQPSAARRAHRSLSLQNPETDSI